MEKKRARLIAFYLPQFHTIPENDEWWGKGFTEWTNVTKAKPLFRGHHQPNLPADLGFYDLRVPETRIAQAELAHAYGIEGFCYWHYWFAGRRILERPFDEVLKSGRPDFPFCLAWANQTWTGIWHGAPGRILIEQSYPGLADYEAHFYAILDALGDHRYLTIEGKPIFLIYRPHELPNPRQFTDCWRGLANKQGLKGLYLLGIADPYWAPKDGGFDGFVIDNPEMGLNQLRGNMRGMASKIYWKILRRNLRLDLSSIRDLFRVGPRVYDYSRYTEFALPPLVTEYDHYPCVVPNWDNTPRSGNNGRILHGTTPELFGIHLDAAIGQVASMPFDKRMVFVKSWNEWAEGNYLEPDQRFGKGYLEALHQQTFR